MASGPERSAPVESCHRQGTCSSHRSSTPLPPPQPGRWEGIWPGRLRQEQRRRAGRRRCPGTHENGGSEATPCSELTGAPLLASRSRASSEPFLSAALSRVSERLVQVQSRNLPQKSSPKQVPRNPEALLAAIRCFWRRAPVVRGVWGSCLNKGHQCPLQEPEGPAADPGFIKTGRIFVCGMSCRRREWPSTWLGGPFSRFATLAFVIR